MVHFERSPCKRLLHLVMKYPEFWCILSTVHAREIVAFRDEICRFFGASFVVIYIPFLRLQANGGGDGESRFECRLQDPT